MNLPTLILPSPQPEPVPVEGDWFAGRGRRVSGRDLEQAAPKFQMPPKARVAVDTALALGEPLLVTGEPGTGKTQLAYHLAWLLKAEPVLHFQVQSISVARDLRYQFDHLRRFHQGRDEQGKPIPRQQFLEKGELWQAIELAREQGRPQVLLIDEIDKAPRDFPNDLLRDLDQMRWDVPELGWKNQGIEQGEEDLRPVVVITSNLERELPGPFLRRCLFCHLEFDSSVLESAIRARRDELDELSDELIELAVARFLELRKNLKDSGASTHKVPSTSEALMWLRALNLCGVDAEALAAGAEPLPYLEVLVKHHLDLESVRGA